MNVLLIHNDYAVRSGEEASVEGIARMLVQRGHQVTWLRRSSLTISSWLSKGRAMISGVHSIEARRSVQALLRTARFDLVQIQNLYPLISTSILRPINDAGIPILMRCPNYRLFCPVGTLYSNGTICERCATGSVWACVWRNCAGHVAKSVGYAVRTAWARHWRSLLDGVNGYLATSVFQKCKMVEYGIPADKIFVMGNCWAGAAAAAQSLGDAAGFVGRTTQEKGFDDFVAVAEKVRHYRFVAAGELGGQWSVERLKSSNVDARGFLHGPAMAGLWGELRCLVFPSRWYDAWPNVLLEAMALGVPVVASSIGPLAEIVEDGVSGLLFRAGDRSDMESKVVSLLEDRRLAVGMGLAGQERWRKLVNADTVYAQWLNAAHNVMTSHG